MDTEVTGMVVIHDLNLNNTAFCIQLNYFIGKMLEKTVLTP